jgi:hypothetical protein
MIERMYEKSGRRLLDALVANLGEEPRWELTPNRSCGFHLHFDHGAMSTADIRAVIDHTLNYSVGVILAPRGPLPFELGPVRNGTCNANAGLLRRS